MGGELGRIIGEKTKTEPSKIVVGGQGEKEGGGKEERGCHPQIGKPLFVDFLSLSLSLEEGGEKLSFLLPLIIHPLAGVAEMPAAATDAVWNWRKIVKIFSQWGR